MNGQPWQQWPAPPPPRPSGSHALLAVLIGLIVAIIGVVALGGVLLLDRSERTRTAGPQVTPGPVATRTRTPSPPPTPTPVSSPRATATRQPTRQPTKKPTSQPTKKPTSQPTKKPTAKPTRPYRPTGAQEPILVRNPAYAQRVTPSDCAQPPGPPPTSSQRYERYFGRLLDCMAGAYQGPLQRAGFSLTKPELLLYKRRVETPCGTSPDGYAVFYCGANETIYGTREAFDNYTSIRLGLYYLLFHEYAHHVQQRIGILDAAYARDEDQMVISRRIELQADCLMGMTIASVRSARFTENDRAELVAWRNQVPDEIHGTSRAQIRWVSRGLKTRTFRACSTWLAHPREVR